MAQRLKYLPAIQETRGWSLGWEDPLEKDGGACRLQSTGSQRIGHDWATSLSLFKVLATQLCPTLCDSMDCSPPESSVHRILQARVLQSVAIPFSRRSSQPSDQTQVSCIAESLPPEPPVKKINTKEDLYFHILEAVSLLKKKEHLYILI